ncbi:hypothetical protein EJ03DRAFT_68169 [Teratosphaeria nubilosa]|uniref:Uncharacterized protein n=1 Tax=Teratosphaeria nubilosa TaxID=161662 RepID=A0A6G1LBY6_9PEZI|nr:hypothetical protein EJ03DRAFT_68169 [Teratosphaeria nubilosa]
MTPVTEHQQSLGLALALLIPPRQQSAQKPASTSRIGHFYLRQVEDVLGARKLTIAGQAWRGVNLLSGLHPSYLKFPLELLNEVDSLYPVMHSLISYVDTTSHSDIYMYHSALKKTVAKILNWKVRAALERLMQRHMAPNPHWTRVQSLENDVTFCDADREGQMRDTLGSLADALDKVIVDDVMDMLADMAKPCEGLPEYDYTPLGTLLLARHQRKRTQAEIGIGAG